MWLEAVLISIIIGIYLYLDIRKPKNFPPGPAWLPVIGSTLTVEKYRQKMGTVSLATAEMAKDYSGGKIVGLRVGNELQVIVNTAEGYRELGANHKLDGRPTGPMFTAKSFGLRRGIIVTDGKFWQEQHRFLVQHLREFIFGKSSDEKTISGEVLNLMDHFKTMIKSSPNGVAHVEMHHAFSIPTLNSILLFVIGTRYRHDDVKMNNMQRFVQEVLESISTIGCLFHYFPILRYLAPEASGYARYMRAVNKVVAFFQEEITNHRATYKPGVIRDFIDAYIEEMQRLGTNASSFSELQLIATCIDLFLAGSDTVSRSLSFGFLHFVRNPNVVKRAQEEMDRVVGRDRLPTWSDKHNLPYTEACVYESLRIFSGVGLGLPHRAVEDTTLLGYFIPKDTMLLVSSNGHHMNEDVWEDPWAFKPERHLNKDGKLQLKSDLILFGLGRRRCIGETFGKKNLFLFISNLLHTFNIRNPEGSSLPDAFPLEGILPSTQPFEAEISLRSTS